VEPAIFCFCPSPLSQFARGRVGVLLRRLVSPRRADRVELLDEFDSRYSCKFVQHDASSGRYAEGFGVHRKAGVSSDHDRHSAEHQDKKGRHGGALPDYRQADDTRLGAARERRQSPISSSPSHSSGSPISAYSPVCELNSNARTASTSSSSPKKA